ncbi:MAG TPA: alpha/beta hydrolase [Stellaceae bacterium]|jgi:pimeloyl-ACP methyl ester carboxylesterase|nr:alpha/beta hydrolase [Stellaceae bacterium]
MVIPQTNFARSRGVRIAYQTLGDGPCDLLVVPGLVSHVGLLWDDPEQARFYENLAAFARVIVYDKRATGLSDRAVAIPAMDERIADTLAVIDAAKSTRAAVLGISEGGKMALTLAARHPGRVRALALYGAFARSPTQEWPPSQVATRFNLIERAWGTGLLPPTMAPSRASDENFRRIWMRFERESASQAVAGALLRMDHDVDVSDVLPAVRVPTLLMHRTGDQRIGVEYGRELAARMRAAHYIELPGEDHLPHYGDSARVIAELEVFLTDAMSGSTSAAA